MAVQQDFICSEVHNYVFFSLSQPGSAIHLSLVREAANYKLKYGRKKEATSDLEQLWKQNTNDVRTLAQLISAYSLVDQDKAKAYPQISLRSQQEGHWFPSASWKDIQATKLTYVVCSFAMFSCVFLNA